MKLPGAISHEVLYAALKRHYEVRGDDFNKDYNDAAAITGGMRTVSRRKRKRGDIYLANEKAPSHAVDMDISKFKDVLIAGSANHFRPIAHQSSQEWYATEPSDLTLESAADEKEKLVHSKFAAIEPKRPKPPSFSSTVENVDASSNHSGEYSEDKQQNDSGSGCVYDQAPVDSSG